MIRVPQLATPRLTLRAFAASDFDAYAAKMADPEVPRHRGDGRPLERVDAWRQLAMVVGHWSLRGFGMWAVRPPSSVCATSSGRSPGGLRIQHALVGRPLMPPPVGAKKTVTACAPSARAAASGLLVTLLAKSKS